MTYNTEKKRLGREPVTVVEIDLDTCSLVYGVGLCTAAGATGLECYNTRKTCQDTANYARTTKTYKFISKQNIEGGYIPAIDSTTFTPAQISIGKGLGSRGNVKVNFLDFPYHDRGIDPYALTRSYTPENQGTFWPKLITRNPYYNGRIMRVKTGYMTDPFNTANLTTRTYVIESISMMDSGKAQIVGKDMLKLVDSKRAKCPTANTGTLSAAMTSGAASFTVNSGEGAGYSAAGDVNIGGEVMTYTRSSDTFTVTSHGNYGTDTKAHSAGDLVQEVKIYSSRPAVILHDLLTTYAGIDGDTYIPFDEGLTTPTGTNDDWDDENDNWLNFTINRVLHKPIPVNTLIKEIGEQCQLDLWWDEVNGKIKMKANTPLLGGSAPMQLNDNAHLIKDSIKVIEQPDLRVSQVRTWFDPITPLETDKEEHYNAADIDVDTDSESADQNNGERIKTILANWFNSSNTSQAAAASSRYLSRFLDTPKMITFDLDAKDESLVLGDLVQLNTREIQRADGSNELYTVILIEISEKRQGDTYQYKAFSYTFTSRYGFIMPNSSNHYGSATDNEKQTGCYIAPNGSKFADDGEQYLIA